MKTHREAAKIGMSKKLASYGGSSKGIGSTFEAAEPVGSEQRESKPDKEPGVQSIRMAKNGGMVKRLDRSPRSGRFTGGRVHKADGGGAWEGSEKDKAEDAKLAKKHGMSMKDWEKSDADKKHDREERASGGRVGKGKTTVNIVLNGSPGGQQPPMAPPAPMPMMRPPMPPAPPPQAAPPPGGPPVPPMGGPAVSNPLARAKGGRVNKDVDVKAPGRTSDGYAKMDYAALGGKGRRQKIEAQS